MPHPSPITLRAHAKINLALSVGPPEPPRGYHPIASWFAPIDLADEVRIEPYDLGEPNRIEIAWASDAPAPSPIDWPTEKDLGVRALRLLEEHVGRALPIALTILKRIPVGGGLGGGSSDAASVLMGANRSCELGLSADTLRTLAQRLGSDIAFFIHDDAESPPRAGVVTGFGEHIERVPCPAAALMLFFPPFGCPTGDVYREYDRDPRPLDAPRIRSLVAAAARSARIDGRTLFNDLAGPAARVRPELAAIRRDLVAALGPSTPVHITGSGSTLFALIDGAHAEELQARCADARPDLRVVRAHIPPPAPAAA